MSSQSVSPCPPPPPPPPSPPPPSSFLLPSLLFFPLDVLFDLFVLDFLLIPPSQWHHGHFTCSAEAAPVSIITLCSLCAFVSPFLPSLLPCLCLCYCRSEMRFSDTSTPTCLVYIVMKRLVLWRWRLKVLYVCVCRSSILTALRVAGPCWRNVCACTSECVTNECAYISPKADLIKKRICFGDIQMTP